MQIKHERGYLIPAFNTADVDYVGMAVMLADSIKHHHPGAKVALMTDDPVSADSIDYVCALPYGDQAPDSAWKLCNDWQVFWASPFRQTIKLEADMILASPFDHWWTLLENRDVVISRGCRNIFDRPGTSRYYRSVFNNNHLPDLYNAITYWRMSQTAQDFFKLVRKIFEQWEDFRSFLKFSDEQPTTDLVYAIAAMILGPETVTLPPGYGPSVVHMKSKIIGTRHEDWTKELVWEIDPLRIQTLAQSGMVHYNVKGWQP